MLQNIISAFFIAYFIAVMKERDENIGGVFHQKLSTIFIIIFDQVDYLEVENGGFIA